jgi:lysophospholipase L1-like esterase
MPVAMDLGTRSGAPLTYKGLPLALSATGSPEVTAVDGVIGVVCIGMSNGNQECSEFQSRVSGEYAPAVDPNVRVVNCAVGGHAIERWIEPEFDEVLWRRCIEERLPQRGVRLDQVRVIWHKAANQFTTVRGNVKPPYPNADSDYHTFIENLSRFAARVQPWFPAVQAVYTTSRSYGGFANNPARGEPLSYEEGHALNTWLAENPSVDGVWYGWGPYIWAPECTSGQTNGSGVCYGRDDYVDDGVHPSATGRARISALMHARFLAEDWYRRD